MSTTNKKTIYWITQLIGWFGFYLLIFGVNIVAGLVKTTPTFIFYGIEVITISILATHLIRNIIIKYNWLNLSLLPLIGRSIGIAILFAICVEFTEVLFNYVLPKDYLLKEQPTDFASKTIGGIIGNALLFSFWLSFYYTYLFIEKSRKQEIKDLHFQTSKNEVELKNLREQINPHFLFNSLNSIKALVEIDKDEAKMAITKLSNLLRKSIQLSKHKLVSIADELEIVTNYIDLEKIRFEERIQSTLTIEPSVLKCQIPPLMIQTLVENSIKHGLSKTIEGGVLLLDIKSENDIVIISIKNTGNLKKISESEGIGLENTKKRLNLLFGESAKFSISQIEDLVCVNIQIICKT